jgi:hypothetical protein
MKSTTSPAFANLARLREKIRRIGAFPFACAALPFLALATNANPPAPLLPSLAVLVMTLVAGLTVVTRGYAAVGLIEILGSDLHAPAVRERVIQLRRARFFAVLVLASLAVCWLPLFALRFGDPLAWPALGDVCLLALPLLRAARLSDLCSRYRPPAAAEYAFYLVEGRIGQRACALGHADLGLNRLEFVRAYLRD